ncbi:hypothetical protein Afil01_31750 [Actinorhabdospora filicis]|uniref:Uncharacterized protein n=1 Tax=Actinorhabdospora filicis TaxID=1785913 RepID=A0A9W6W9V0_9ACTN|nr:hypothetical protein [Actinorhabdospora filicis]GLZ78368.1 hypothetical protein Afil01_31750 [Actinorhabdospora filicis]
MKALNAIADRMVGLFVPKATATAAGCAKYQCWGCDLYRCGFDWATGTCGCEPWGGDGCC